MGDATEVLSVGQSARCDAPKEAAFLERVVPGSSTSCTWGRVPADDRGASHPDASCAAIELGPRRPYPEGASAATSPLLRRGLQALVRSGRAELASAGETPLAEACTRCAGDKSVESKRNRWARPRPRGHGTDRRLCPARPRIVLGRWAATSGAPIRSVGAIKTAAQDSPRREVITLGKRARALGGD
jgi:hypothetical protein